MKKVSAAHMLLMVVVVLQMAVSLLFSVLPLKLPAAPALLLSQLTMILPFAVYCAVAKQNPLTLIGFKRVNILTVILSVLAVICAYPAVIFLNFISMLFVENAMLDVMPGIVSMGLFPALILMAVMPAVVEETVFRGTLYNTYRLRRPVAGIFLSAFLFGLMHMNFNQMPYAFFLGIIMALMFEACDSIAAPMIMHLTMNGVSTVMNDVMSGLPQTQVSASGNLYEMQVLPEIIAAVAIVLGVIALISLAMTLFIVYAAFHVNGRHPKTALQRKSAERLIDPFMIMFVVYALARCIFGVLKM